jgi:hypothetical protein
MAIQVINGTVKSVKKQRFTWYTGGAFRKVVWETGSGEMEKKSFLAAKTIAEKVETGETGDFFISESFMTGKQLFAYQGENGSRVFQWSNMVRNLSFVLFFGTIALGFVRTLTGDPLEFSLFVLVIGAVIFLFDLSARKSARAAFDQSTGAARSPTPARPGPGSL